MVEYTPEVDGLCTGQVNREEADVHRHCRAQHPGVGNTSGSLQMFQVRQVLRSACRLLVPLEVFQVDESYSDAVNVHLDPCSVTFVEIHSVQGNEQVDSIRRIPELNNLIGLKKVGRPQAKRTKAKLFERLDEFRCIVQAGPKPHVHVLRIAGMTVEGYSVAANNKVPDVIFV
jgi:hypothetical protein